MDKIKKWLGISSDNQRQDIDSHPRDSKPEPKPRDVNVDEWAEAVVNEYGETLVKLGKE